MARSTYVSSVVSLNGAGPVTTNIDSTTFPAPIRSGTPHSILVEALLFASTTASLAFAFGRAPTLADNDGILAHLGTAEVIPHGEATIRFLILTSAGNAASGGANDYVLLRGSTGIQSPG